MTDSLSPKIEDNRAPPAEAIRERTVGVLLVGLPEAFGEALELQIRDAGQTSVVADDAEALARNLRPSLAIVNLDLSHGLELVSSVCELFEAADVVAITNTSCVIRVAQAVRRGASIVLARPTTFGQIVAAVTHPNARTRTLNPMSLDRAIWEFLNQAVEEAGSISGAARLLRLDRTSLKRMLRKVPSL